MARLMLALALVIVASTTIVGACGGSVKKEVLKIAPSISVRELAMKLCYASGRLVSRTSNFSFAPPLSHAEKNVCPP